MSTLSRCLESPSAPSSTQNIPPAAQRKTSGFRQRVAEKKEAFYKQKALHSARLPSASYTLSEFSPRLATPSSSQGRAPGQNTKRHVCTIRIHADKNTAGVCVLVQSPTLINVEECAGEEELPEDIDLAVVLETSVSPYAAPRRKNIRAPCARAEAHLAEFRGQPELGSVVTQLGRKNSASKLGVRCACSVSWVLRGGHLSA
ncbi:hypothetical protein BOTBODRAFT_56663 [Botryobasidium botryosum FD-172 SS1]|uniref:Uncharacterized protein n=1 Tax=Botryobasidium botryosum (strain FD-172 SS1) TaxID=930990 RepID=A0A067MM04_BOTB1|nr:hypothetical protein BOTBODRAFT_56663 [Botryobasidium botryosum FD-172 SS1]